MIVSCACQVRAYADELLQTMLAELGSPAANAGPPAGAGKVALMPLPRTPMGSSRTAPQQHLPGFDRVSAEPRRPAGNAPAAQAASGPGVGLRAGLGQEADARLRMEVDALLGDVCQAGMAGRAGTSAAAEAADALLDTLEAATAMAGGPSAAPDTLGGPSAAAPAEAALQAAMAAAGGEPAGAAPGGYTGKGDTAGMTDAADAAAGAAAASNAAGVVCGAAPVLGTGEAVAGDPSIAGAPSLPGLPKKQGHAATGLRHAVNTQPSPGEGSGPCTGEQESDGRQLASAAPSGPSGSSEAQQHERSGLADGAIPSGSDTLSGLGPDARPAPERHLVQAPQTDSEPASAAGADGALTLSLSSDRDDALGSSIGNEENEAPAGGGPAGGSGGRSPGGYPMIPPGAASPARALSGRGSPAAQPPAPKSVEQAADPVQSLYTDRGASPTRARATRRVPLAAMELELALGSPIVVPSPHPDPAGSPLRRSTRFLAEAAGSGSGLGLPHALRSSAPQGRDGADTLWEGAHGDEGAPGLMRSPDAPPLATPPHSGAAGPAGAPAAAATPEATAAPVAAGERGRASLTGTVCNLFHPVSSLSSPHTRTNSQQRPGCKSEHTCSAANK